MTFPIWFVTFWVIGGCAAIIGFIMLFFSSKIFDQIPVRIKAIVTFFAAAVIFGYGPLFIFMIVEILRATLNFVFG